jgi:hypothetical protein
MVSYGRLARPDSQGLGVQGEAAVAQQRKSVLLRLDPAVYDALARWATDELRSTNAQIEMLLRQALIRAGRLGSDADPTHEATRGL